MSKDDDPETDQTNEKPDRDEKLTNHTRSNAQAYARLVGHSFDRTFTDRPLLAAAMAAQLKEQLRSADSFRGIQESISRIYEAADPRSILPPEFWQDFQDKMSLKPEIRRFRQLLDRTLQSNELALTRASDFSDADPSRAAYSPSMTSPADYFSADESVIDSMRELNRRIGALVAKNPSLPLVWRGVRDADWAIHSSLFRQLCAVNNVVPPSEHPAKAQPYPDEDQLVRAEREILHVARTDWRFDGMSALETFARIQHSGGPTRLLDVTKNPYIATWFAVEQNDDTDGKDARLIAFATQPVSKPDKPAAPSSMVELDAEWGDRIPPWHSWSTSAARQGVDWGTGARRRLWIPPAYSPRIAAQNAAFIVDGVPITSARTAPYFKTGDGGYWSRADLLATSSIYAKTAKPTRECKYNSRNLAPTFTFRIVSAVKAEVREFLESQFGYTRSYVYPDITELARYLGTLPLATLL